jgi:hypothetical protein
VLAYRSSHNCGTGTAGVDRAEWTTKAKLKREGFSVCSAIILQTGRKHLRQLRLKFKGKKVTSFDREIMTRMNWILALC